MRIGSWVRRNRTRAKWHRVESVVDGDAITRCGRRMALVMSYAGRRGVPLEVTEVEPLTRAIGQPQNCRACA